MENFQLIQETFHAFHRLFRYFQGNRKEIIMNTSLSSEGFPSAFPVLFHETVGNFWDSVKCVMWHWMMPNISGNRYAITMG
jgi:hypothetical protein